MRKAIFAWVALVVAASGGAAQEGPWAEKLFKKNKSLERDFGNQPRGSQLHHQFVIENIYAVPLTLSTRVSCSCVTAKLSTSQLNPREKAYLDVTMDTHRFTGNIAKKIFVDVGPAPQYVSTAELKVSANVRADVVFNPGELNFGVVSSGQSVTKVIDVEYAGNLNWQVVDVVTNNAPLTVELEDWRQPGRVGYHLKTTLKKEVPAGAHKWEVFLKTNDPASPLIPVLVEAAVQEAITVSPLTGINVQANQEVLVRAAVRGDRPFRILAVDGLGDDVTVMNAVPTEAMNYHQLILKLKLPNPGEFRRELSISTDLRSTPLKFPLEGVVNP